MRSYLRLLCVVAVAAVFIGCSTSREAADTDAEALVTLADVETFDPAPYQIELAEVERSVDLTHRVPPMLMRPADAAGNFEGDLVIRSGYRVQIFSGETKSSADERIQQALTWWEEEGQEMEGASTLFPGSLPIRIVYNAPYYKVRIGDFVKRQEAQQSLKFIRKQFPDAWIVPDQVEVYQ